MSYSNKVEYEIIPEGSYKVIRNCAKCGCKRYYINTNNFRMNANGKLLDVWLIYQCEKCKHTLNIMICERKKSSDIPKEEYLKFMENDILLAREYGLKKELFVGNRIEIDLEELSYRISSMGMLCLKNVNSVVIRNPYEIKLRTDRVLSEILHETRSRIKLLAQEEKISELPKYLSKTIEIIYKGGEATNGDRDQGERIKAHG